MEVCLESEGESGSAAFELEKQITKATDADEAAEAKLGRRNLNIRITIQTKTLIGRPAKQPGSVSFWVTRL